MQLAIVISQLLLQLMPLITVGTQHLFTFIGSVREAAQQTGEWTEAMELAYQSRLLAKAAAPQSQPDPS